MVTGPDQREAWPTGCTAAALLGPWPGGRVGA